MAKSRKYCKKKLDGKCQICGETNFKILDPHRINPGRSGGTYDPRNIVTLCANCHRKEQAGEIKFEVKHYCTNGQWMLHYFIGEEEFWKLENE
jgi:5-methylcytosine-specific restriction endonuclease McrA